MLGVEKLADGRVWLQTLKKPHLSKNTLLWLPFGGGMAHTVKPLCQFLPSDMTVYGLEGPGRLRTSGNAIEDILELSRFYCDVLPNEALEGAVLLGHSVGALIAAFVAQELEAQGRPAKALIMGAARPPHTINDDRKLSELSDQELFEWWREINKDSVPESHQRQLFDLHLCMMRPDISVYESAADVDIKLHNTPTKIVLGRSDPICKLDIAEEWEKVDFPYSLEVIDGGHLFAVEHPFEYSQLVRDFLDKLENTSSISKFREDIVSSIEFIKLSNDSHYSFEIPKISSARVFNYDWNRDRITEYSKTVEGFLDRFGVVLLDGLDIIEPKLLSVFLTQLGKLPSPYLAGNSPREYLGNNIYTASEYSSDLDISPHTEMSYLKDRPRWISFSCKVAAASGGETSITSMAEVAKALPQHITDKFRRQNIKYKRLMKKENGIGKSWIETFNTEIPQEVEKILDLQRLNYRWSENHEFLWVDHLGPGIVSHSETGQDIWLNQAEQWHPSSLPEDVEEYFKSMEIEPPHDVSFEDGSLIDRDDLSEVRKTISEKTVYFGLQSGQVMIFDNNYMAHGRKAFNGFRKIFVSINYEA